MTPLPVELIEDIHDFMNGDIRDWRHKFNTVINEINKLKFFVFTEYSNKYCNTCRYNDTEFTIENDYDEALRLYYSYVNKLFNCVCGCFLKECRILPVSDDYYDALNYRDVMELLDYADDRQYDYTYDMYDPYYNYNNNYYYHEYFNYYDNYY